jgi:4-phosphopantoate--beta-alanine ligase
LHLFIYKVSKKAVDIPKSHPRYLSLKQREKIEKGIEEGYVTPTGMIAQGRGECFDYLIGERTIPSADKAEKAAVSLLLRAQDPVISVNGNVAALCARDIVKLAKAINAKIEVNLFYWTPDREKKVERILEDAGAGRVYGAQGKVRIPGLESARGMVDPEGIGKADVVLVALEDGDRTDALVRAGKKVIAIDLNPLSRTAQKATVSIVDNVVRAVPNLIKLVKEGCSVKGFDNKKNLAESIREIINRLEQLSL